MKGFILAGIVLFSSNVLATDYTQVSCTSDEERRSLMDAYNEMLQKASATYHATDVYDVQVISQTENQLVCKGLIDFSSGEEGVVATFSAKDNSFGEPILSVIPESGE